MFTSCGVMSGQSHYLPRDVVRPHPGLEFNRQLHLEVGGAPGSCLTYQTPVYNNPPAQPSVASNALNLSTPTMAQPPPPPPPPPLPAPPASAAGPPGGPKLGQGGFKKICRTEEDGPSPFPGLAPGVLEMRVKEGSKIRNLMGFAMARMQSDKADGGGGAPAGAGGLRQVVFTGSGRAVTKTITCAEIMKRKVGALHQLTKLRYKGVKEVWESHDGGASEMTVHRTVPSISILLSKDPLDPREPGYQPPETLSALWEEREGADTQPPPPTASKRPPGQTPSGGYPDCKRACFGEGGSVVPPSLSG